MATQVTPDLKRQIETYLQNRSRGETTSLLYFYRLVFGRELKTNCSVCIEDAVKHLKSKINTQKMAAVNYKWLGGKDKKVIIRHSGRLTEIGAHNFSDVYGELISGISKYAHLVEYVGGEVEPEKEHLKKTEDKFIQVGAVTTSTLPEAKTDEPKQKRKYTKREKK